MKKILLFLVLLSGIIFTANAAEGDYIIKYRDDIPKFYTEEEPGYSLGGGMFLVSAEKALSMKNADMLEICEADTYMTYHSDSSSSSSSTPPPTNDPFLANQYNLGMIKAVCPWTFKSFGNDVLVGVIDSGLAPNHPDIDYSRVVPGYNFGANPSESDYATNRYDTTDFKGHGSRVAGTIIATRNNSQGIAGIADKVKLVPLKVADKNGNIPSSAVIDAINSAWEDYGCDVINISLGSGTPSNAQKKAIDDAMAHGCIVVSSVGNDTESDPGDHYRFPASYPGVIGVASVDSSYAHVESSVVNPSSLISAPGDRVPSLNHEDGYVLVSGTSFASPQVAAAAAIAKNIDPDITPAQFAYVLRNTAYRPDAVVGAAPVHDNEIGYGVLNLERMVLYMISGRKVYVSPFDESTSSVTIFNRTNTELPLTSIIASYTGNGAMVDYSTAPLKIPVGKAYVHVFPSKKAYDSLRHYLWGSMKDIAPIEKRYKPREFIK